MKLENAFDAVLTVGTGRGFVVEGRNHVGGLERYVITAAHCLPERADGQRLPPPHGFSHTEQRSYANLLAPLGEQPLVWCECLFVDPIADLAVLGAPDDQTMSEEAEAYESLVDAATPLAITEPPSQPIPEEVARLVALEKQIGMTEQAQRARRQCPAFLLSLDNQWFSCRVEHHPNGMLNILDAVHDIAGGMSGSPIIAEDGTAIGIVCLGTHAPNPRLMGNLPGWFLKMLSNTVLIIVLLLAAAIPLPKVGSCPSGYASEASWCVPMQNAPVAVPKGNGRCPSTMRQSGNYCLDTKPQRR